MSGWMDMPYATNLILMDITNKRTYVATCIFVCVHLVVNYVCEFVHVRILFVNLHSMIRMRNENHAYGFGMSYILGCMDTLHTIYIVCNTYHTL